MIGRRDSEAAGCDAIAGAISSAVEVAVRDAEDGSSRPAAIMAGSSRNASTERFIENMRESIIR
ncbi:MAG: hypothetical protein ACUVXJ_04940 [Phycisphaerae bacterium]